MGSANIGWLFYKDYYSTLTSDDYKFMLLKEKEQNETRKEEIKTKIDKKVKNIIEQTPKLDMQEEVLGNVHLKATTTYPGLLLGSGNPHELPSVKGQVILGFHFDYTSGLPTIQGSSIKGVLRSAFQHSQYIQELLNDAEISIKDLEKEIFDNGDIFFDAPVIKADNFNKILGDDFLTSHGDNPLQNPKPLRFIKVLPEVTFRFDFNLSDGLITKEQKTKLFESILKDLGLGAKTNVGYGKFINFTPYKTEQEKEREKKALQLKKEQKEQARLQALENEKREKEQKAKEGVSALLECKTLEEGFKLLKDSFGAKPKPTPEQKEIIQQYFNKQKNLSKANLKTFKKYGIS